MKLLLIDYAGHEFTLQLAAQLTGMGARVDYSYCCSNITPHADFDRYADRGLAVHPVSLRRQFEKRKLVRRAFDEIEYGLRTIALLRSSRPDVVVAAQMPVLALLLVSIAARLLKRPLILWLQDIQGNIASSESRTVGRILAALENAAIRWATKVVSISPVMVEHAQRVRRKSDVELIENWANLDAVQPAVHANAWAERHGIADTFNFLYSGTLGLKHRPLALADLAEHFRDDPKVKVVVVSEGHGSDLLKLEVESRKLDNLLLLPLAPAGQLQDILATGDVLLVLLDRDFNDACVPSKVLSYLAAGRSILGLMPPENLAAITVEKRAMAGFVTNDTVTFQQRAEQLRSRPSLGVQLGSQGRRYAEMEFDIALKAKRFLAIIEAAQESSFLKTAAEKRVSS